MAKAGRKRKAVRRYPNGQPVHADPREVVVASRMRQFGFSKDRAKSGWAGYEIGRMALQGVFGPDHIAQKAIDAVEDYVQAMADYMRYKCPGQPMPKAMDYLAGRGIALTEEPSEAKIRRIVVRYNDALGKLAGASGLDKMVFHEVAFHDRKCAPHRVEAVENCVRLLMGR